MKLWEQMVSSDDPFLSQQSPGVCLGQAVHHLDPCWGEGRGRTDRLPGRGVSGLEVHGASWPVALVPSGHQLPPCNTLVCRPSRTAVGFPDVAREGRLHAANQASH